MGDLFPHTARVLRLELLVQLVLAVVLGGAIGLERELKGKPAGLRTNILISIGATLFTVLSMRMAALPRCNSARASLSVHKRSAVVIGRLIVAAAQSLTPPGCMDTCPLMYLRRATRDGGSSANDIATTDAMKSVTNMGKANCRRILITPAPLNGPAK